ncbi:hypothetical protein IWX85_000635 [Polaromonas sp. CG_9.11]|nr:hypothetical protein [Polaromonas sp. CG_9.11]
MREVRDLCKAAVGRVAIACPQRIRGQHGL